MITSDDFQELAKAMSAMQRDMKPAAKDSVNPHYKSRYSDLASVWDAIRGPLTNNGLSVWQDAITTADGNVSVTTRIVHASGQWVEFGPFCVRLAKADAHGLGSATSYAKRYALCAALGVVSDDDDDGNKASQQAAQQSPSIAIQASPRAKPAYISHQQLTALDELIGSDKAFRDKLLTYLRKFDVNSLAEIPANEYEMIYRHAKANKLKHMEAEENTNAHS